MQIVNQVFQFHYLLFHFPLLIWPRGKSDETQIDEVVATSKQNKTKRLPQNYFNFLQLCS